jgi:hypothetical protein
MTPRAPLAKRRVMTALSMSPTSSKPGSESAAAGRGDLDDLADEPAGRVEVVHRDVGEESPGALYVAEAGRAHVPEGGAEEIHLADVPRADLLLRGAVVGVVPAVKTHLQLDARLTHGLDDVVGALEIVGDGLLAEDVLAARGGGFDHLGVQVRRAGHDDRLDLRVFEKVFVVGGPPHAPQPGSVLARHVLGGVSDAYQPGSGDAPGQVGGVETSYPSQTHQSHAHGLDHRCLVVLLADGGRPGGARGLPAAVGWAHPLAPSRVRLSALPRHMETIRRYPSATEDISSSSAISPASQRRACSP